MKKQVTQAQINEYRRQLEIEIIKLGGTKADIDEIPDKALMISVKNKWNPWEEALALMY